MAIHLRVRRLAPRRHPRLIAIGLAAVIVVAAVAAVLIIRAPDRGPGPHNADRYSGVTHDAVAAVDDFDRSYRNRKAKHICRQFFGPDLAGYYDDTFGGCEATWTGDHELGLEVNSARAESQSNVHVVAADATGQRWAFDLYLHDGHWLVEYLDDPEA
jgi:hypothetical protein